MIMPDALAYTSLQRQRILAVTRLPDGPDLPSLGAWWRPWGPAHKDDIL